MPVDQSLGKSSTTTCRYPKRKRNTVSYTEPQDEEGLDVDIKSESDTDELEWGSRKKPRKASPKKKAVPRQKPFPFMSLPPELRNKIYELVLVNPNGMHIRSGLGRYRRRAWHCSPATCVPSPGYSQWSNQDWLRPRSGDLLPAPADYKPMLVPALLATCKAIYAEAATVLYSQPFFVSDTTAMQTFLIRLRPATMELLRDVTIISWCSSRAHKAMNLPTFGLLRGATNLKRLHIFDTLLQANYSFASKDPDFDEERALHVARKVYRDCFPWLEAVVGVGGLEALQSVLELKWGHFMPRYAPAPAHDSASAKKRFEKMEGIMFGELMRLMKMDAH